MPQNIPAHTGLGSRHSARASPALNTLRHLGLYLLQLQLSLQGAFSVESPRKPCPAPPFALAVLLGYSLCGAPQASLVFTLPWIQLLLQGHLLYRESWDTQVYTHLSFSYSAKVPSVHRTLGHPGVHSNFSYPARALSTQRSQGPPTSHKPPHL